MTLRSKLATGVGRLTRWALTTFTSGGSSLPGKLALALDPNLLAELAKNYDVVIITGTNGKTLTTALTVHALAQSYDHILTNPTGSNMKQGIVSTFLSAPALPKGQRGVAVLEVDEGSLKHVVKALAPKAFVHTNVFRDQMDRYGEIYTIYKLMADAAKQVPEATVIANGDSPLFNSVALPNPRVYFGFDHEEDHEVTPHYNTDGILCPECQHILCYHSNTYANLGKYYCPHCGFKRPDLSYRVTALEELALTHSRFAIEGHEYAIPVAGLYNIYNALAAYALGRFLGVSQAQIKDAFESDERVFGRQEVINVDGKEVTLILVGLNQVLDMIETDPQPFSFAFLLNANYADGIDTSWIWDGNFEKLVQHNIPQYMTGGERYKDITTRLTMAGVDSMWHEPDLTHVIAKIKGMPTKHVYILATYTAVLQLRKQLAEKGYIKGGMD